MILPVPIVLVTYLLSIVFAQRRLREASSDALNDSVQLLTLVAFMFLVGILVMYGGGVDVWPTIIPFSAVQVLVYAIFILGKFLGGRRFVRSIDGFVTTLATTIFTTTAMTVMLPKMRGRYMEVFGTVFLGLPLLFALPALLKSQSGVGDDVRAAVEASRLVYSRSTSAMFDEVEFVNNRDTGARCGVYVSKDAANTTIYIAFAGSDSETDWVRTNFDLEEETYPSKCTVVRTEVPRVHKGFLKAWKSIEEPVWDKVSKVMLRYAGSGKVVICGHSLGGAMATLAGLDIFWDVEEKYQKSLSVITFGSPRVGNASFRALYTSTIPRSLRVVTIYDPVPKTTINDFVHVPTEYMIPGVGVNPHGLTTYMNSLKNW